MRPESTAWSVPGCSGGGWRIGCATGTIVRASGASEFPARALLVTAMNPCKCGWLGHPRRGCRCTPKEIAQHNARVSGPVLDRIDIQIEVPALTARELQAASAGESSAVVRARVLAARRLQRSRGCLNAALPPSRLAECCALDSAGRRLVTDAVDRGGMSARAVHRAMRVARTIADLAGEDQLGLRALAEALQYRAYETRRPLPR
jgi:magnesium chelatase family protein